MQISASVDYLAAGGNRQPAAADWDVATGLVAFGAGRNLAIWNPQDIRHLGLKDLLPGHTGDVNAVKFYSYDSALAPAILTGSADRTMRVWQIGQNLSNSFCEVGVLKGHTGSILCIAVLTSEQLVATGGSDGTIRVWKLDSQGSRLQGTLCQIIDTTPKIFPLSIALHKLELSGAIILALGGSGSSAQIYVAAAETRPHKFYFKGSLVGHESWIRSLDFVDEGNDPLRSDVLLASASQDKYVRIWRVHRKQRVGDDKPDPSRIDSGETLSTTALSFPVPAFTYDVTFEALLLGHEDWIYSAKWNKGKDTHPRLLTASADSSLFIWELESSSGVWECKTRLGEMTSQKGATTATGSPGGFWTGLWSKDGSSILGLGRTGSWRRWVVDHTSNQWEQVLGISGHIKEAKDCSWSPHGQYLLSVSSDQTTRLHARWKQDGRYSWHEFARPQIHGYDINCVAALSLSRFISGADEKLLRVFDEPRSVAEMLSKLCLIEVGGGDDLPKAANIPVLGLSNKALTTDSNEDYQDRPLGDDSKLWEQAPVPGKPMAGTLHPPFEDVLSRHTLWPEKEKLYGHGYEISAVAASHDGLLVATACKASSIEHAVIRLYETRDWREIKPALIAHSLTVSCIRFSSDDNFLLSVGRDRQWTVFVRSEAAPETYEFCTSNSKAHSRMILGADWAPVHTARVFATAGRDKCIRLWSEDADALALGFSSANTITSLAPVTTISFSSNLVHGHLILASGLDTGEIQIHLVDSTSLKVKGTRSLDASVSPSLCTTHVEWQPKNPGVKETDEDSGVSERHLAVSSDDGSIRIFTINVEI